MDESLRKAGVPPQKWNSIIEYCSHLSWYFHLSKSKELERTNLKEFNSNFELVEHTVDFSPRLEELLKARILVKSGDYFRFRYHYIFYYLKGRYLSKRLDNNEIQLYVKRCCTHLYARENANTLLFLAHHAYSNKFFLACIITALNEPFAGIPAIRFDGKDTVQVADIFCEAQNIIYTGESPEDHRNRSNAEKDEANQETDGLASCEEESDELSLPAQLSSTIKTVEILGQVLKNQFAGIDRAQRVQMLLQLLRGPLRGISTVLNLFSESRNFVLDELKILLKEKQNISDPERLDAMSKRILAYMMQEATFGILLKTAISISSRDLIEDIHAAAESLGTPAARLIELGVRLDSPDPIPRELIKKLHENIKSDLVGGQLIQLFTVQRLYMFKITYDDKQWLASQKILDLKNQTAIEYRTRQTKRLER